jgi:N-formylglutamate deformylase
MICDGQLFQSDDEFLDAFLTCRVPAASFDHRAHLRVAWILLQRYPIDDAVTSTCEGIARLAAHLGATKKFHYTLTAALVRVMAAAGATDRTRAFDAFLLANAPLVENARAVIAWYYSTERLATVDARTGFIEPDLAPLP